MPASQPTPRADQRRNPNREAFWRQTLSDRLQSGLSIRAFCQREGLSEPAYHYWRRELKKRDAETTAAASFLPVEVQLPATPIEIVFSQGTTVRVGNGCDRTTLETVLAALEQRTC
ncbi:IS66 family insertion sequence element accessory protein TnpA [Gimesia chilikensis]|uniref:IS66 family insertion sequence element accessory protein TnpB n=1 Tax=Gimesia chilikensis TaxID=2605989 RepID=A0A517PSQ7_9PLAN|nr:IS66 family insertion sequence element accessory protein TnpB [Gimesia chilikensis]QDT22405.1 hypothetical protein HG66A1_42130 [Gimesia chilikensis]